MRDAGSTVNWNEIASGMPGRDAKRCPSHWIDVLYPSMKKGPWSPEEERLLARLHRQLGNSWADISKRIVGRTAKQCSNYWMLNAANFIKQTGRFGAQRG